MNADQEDFWKDLTKFAARVGTLTAAVIGVVYVVGLVSGLTPWVLRKRIEANRDAIETNRIIQFYRDSTQDVQRKRIEYIVELATVVMVESDPITRRAALTEIRRLRRAIP